MSILDTTSPPSPLYPNAQPNEIASNRSRKPSLDRKASKADVKPVITEELVIKRDRSASLVKSTPPPAAAKKTVPEPSKPAPQKKQLPSENTLPKKKLPSYASGTVASQSRTSRTSLTGLRSPPVTSAQISMTSIDVKELDSLPPESDTASIDFIDLMSGPQTSDVKLAKLKEAYMKQQDAKKKMKEENKQLRRHVAVLNKRLVKDIGKPHTAAQLQMPSSVEVF